MITLDQFKKMLPSNAAGAAEWYEISSDFFPKYDITTKNRIAGFMAQTSHESKDFKVLQENLNYSEAGLLKTFPRYFNRVTAKQHARKPEQIANIVYDDANRTNKLGNTRPGDGWKFRGRGLIQLTGRWNYEAFGKTIGKSADDVAEYLETKEGAFESALWFWSSNRINRFADADDIRGMSKAVNGGEVGLEDRMTRYLRNKTVLAGLAVDTPVNKPVPPQENTTLQRGSRGPLVQQIQQALKIGADGIYGVTTEAAVRSWQRSNKYAITGKLDQNQINKLLGV